MLGAGDAFMSGFLRGWLGGESLRDRGDLGQCLRRLRRVAPALLAGIPDLRGAAVLPRATAASTARCARTRRSTTSTGRRRAARDIPSLMALAIDHRVAARGDRRQGRRDRANASATSRCWRCKAAARGRRRPRRLRHAARREATAARRCSNSRRHGFSWIGRPVELPGSRPLRFEFSQDIGSQLVEWPVDHCIKCLCFYHPDDPAGAEAGAAGEAARAVRGGAQGRPRAAGRDHRRQARPARRRHDRRARWQELYALGIKPDWWKLEPQASAARLEQRSRR